MGTEYDVCATYAGCTLTACDTHQHRASQKDLVKRKLGLLFQSELLLSKLHLHLLGLSDVVPLHQHRRFLSDRILQDPDNEDAKECQLHQIIVTSLNTFLLHPVLGCKHADECFDKSDMDCRQSEQLLADLCHMMSIIARHMTCVGSEVVQKGNRCNVKSDSKHLGNARLSVLMSISIDTLCPEPQSDMHLAKLASSRVPL